MMTLSVLILTVCLLPAGTRAEDCANGLVDGVGVIINGYRNVLDGIHKSGSKSHSFKDIIGDQLNLDICDLETLARTIFEDCKTCPGCEAEAENCVFSERDVIFVLDSSSTLNGANFSGGQFGKVKDAANAIITGLDQGGDIIRVAALFFASDVKIVFDLDEFKGNLSGATETLAGEKRLRGGTNLADALKDVQSQILNSPGDRAEVGNTLIIIGDGESTAPLSTLNAYNNLTNEFPDIEVVTVGVGTLNVTELEFLARPPTKFFPVEKAGALDQITDDILDELCTCDPPCENGSTCEGNRCKCASGYFGSRCQIKSVCT